MAAVSVMLLVVALVVWVVMSTYYEFEPAALVAHSGPWSWRIAFADIVSVRESRSSRSGPALSMDRLEIEYRPGRVLLLSPADKAGFLAELRRRTAHVD